MQHSFLENQRPPHVMACIAAEARPDPLRHVTVDSVRFALRRWLPIVHHALLVIVGVLHGFCRCMRARRFSQLIAGPRSRVQADRSDSAGIEPTHGCFHTPPIILRGRTARAELELLGEAAT